ncbi:unnamed protein product [Didymodactylos carnosus]|uniref:DUF642 domain-containing protein n=1 Tax=Didymodactylos carnosus TaxID=1234261 RepID=A0A8S2EVE1_9BILA|nr:unnamed protein product [Didymodactylos carnosus]CAF4058124.1 unnamed protein product [Didymodactylos carnosus]
MGSNLGSQSFTSYTYTFPATRTQYVLCFGFSNAPGQFNLDDVSVASIVGGTNLLTNGGFESSSSSYPGWTATGSSYNSNFEIETSPVHTGLYSFHNGVSTMAYLGQSFAATIGTTYNVSFWLYNNKGIIASNAYKIFLS